MDERSLTGSSGELLVDAAPEVAFDAAEYRRSYARRQHPPKPPKALSAPRPADGASGVCRRCGMKNGAKDRAGNHPTAAACIAALRDRLARWE
jgi:hypothetical protein